LLKSKKQLSIKKGGVCVKECVCDCVVAVDYPNESDSNSALGEHFL